TSLHITPQPPRSTLFPYTTLFRSHVGVVGDSAAPRESCARGQILVRGTQRIARRAERIARVPELLRGYRPGGRDVLASVVIRERSEEHTSELQSLRHLVCRLLLEK